MGVLLDPVSTLSGLKEHPKPLHVAYTLERGLCPAPYSRTLRLGFHKRQHAVLYRVQCDVGMVC